MLGLSDGGAGKPQRTPMSPGYPRGGPPRRVRQGCLAFSEGRHHVVELHFVDSVPGACVRLRQHTHEMAGVVPPEVPGGVLPTSHGLGALRIEACIGSEDAEHPVRPGEDVGLAPVVSSVVQHPVPFFPEHAGSEPHLIEREGPDHPPGLCGCRGLGQLLAGRQTPEVGEKGGSGRQGAGDLQERTAVQRWGSGMVYGHWRFSAGMGVTAASEVTGAQGRPPTSPGDG
jgi:hypothetical protein